MHESMEGSFDTHGPVPSLVRLEIDRRADTCRVDRRDERFVELPRVPDTSSGRAYRYGYAAAAGVSTARTDLPAACFDGLVRYDMERNEALARGFGPGRYVGEPTIVAKHDARNESDAYVLTFCYDRATDTSALLILDGADFAGPPIASIGLPVRVPNGYHGNWIPAGA